MITLSIIAVKCCPLLKRNKASVMKPPLPEAMALILPDALQN
ncbi:hypothetical protein [Shouchella tritolerans]|nr:hypothetical protein [Shouchella tritolerans]